MDFSEILIFVLVFAIVSVYFGLQFANFIKINHFLSKDNEFNLDVVKKIDKLCKINIVSYCVAYILLVSIYFLITKDLGLSISIIAFIPFSIMCLVYLVGIRIVKNKIKICKIYNYVNFIINIIIMFIPIGFIFMVYGTNLL